MDPVSGEITMAGLNHNSKGDAYNSKGDVHNSKRYVQVAEEMLPAAHGHVKQVFDDDAYDTTCFREKIASKGATANIPPPRNAVIESCFDEANRMRNDAIQAINRLGVDNNSRKLWEKLQRCYIRSLVETTMFS